MKFKLALCQMQVVKEKDENLKRAESFIREAAKNGAQMISLPEIFNCPYSPKYFRAYAEGDDGPSIGMLSRLARELSVYIIGGSIPELDGDALYNTCYILGREGEILGKHRKMHLFDIDVEGGISMRESDSLTAGSGITVVDTEFCKVGVAIRMLALAGAELVVLPGSFTMATGKAHWDITVRCRAIDNQIFFAANSSALDPNPKHYQTFAHSCIVSPWGEVLAQAELEEAIVYGVIDTEKVGSARRQLPLMKHRRPEFYQL